MCDKEKSANSFPIDCTIYFDFANMCSQPDEIDMCD